MRFLLLDRITHIEEGKSIEAHKTWAPTEEFFQDHFPGFPVVPGVLLVEAMAQAGGIMLEGAYALKYAKERERVFPILTVIHKAKFKGFVQPNELTILRGEVASIDVQMGAVQMSTWVGDERRAQVELQYSLIPESMVGERIRLLRQQRERYLNNLKEP